MIRSSRKAVVLLAVAVAFLLVPVARAAAAPNVTVDITATGGAAGTVASTSGGPDSINCSGPPTAGTCSGSFTFSYGQITLTFMPNPGSAFAGWTSGECVGSDLPTCSFYPPFFGGVTVTASVAVALPPPTVTIAAVDPDSITADTATFAGTVNPNGNDAKWYFEYRQVGASSWSKKPVPNGDAGGGTSAVSVSTTAGNLEPNTAYEVRLVATNATSDGTSTVESFTTITSPPKVSTGQAWSVSGTGATLTGTINPRNSDTTYHFAYGVGNAYDHSTSSADIGTGDTPQSIAVRVDGLIPGTNYNFRIIADNGTGGIQVGDGVGFATPSNAETALAPRGYELVSASDTNGIDVIPDMASVDGDQYLYVTAIPAPGARFGGITYYRASRSTGGRWSQGYIGAPSPAPGQVTQAALGLFSAGNLSVAAFYDFADLDPDDRNNSEDVYLNKWGARNPRWLSRDPAIPAGTPQTSPGGADVDYISADGRTVLFGAKRRLLPIDIATGATNSLYGWYDGKLMLISVLPNGTGATTNSTLGSGSGIASSVENAVAADGSRVAFESGQGARTEHLYVRENPFQPQSSVGPDGECVNSDAGCTVEASASAPGLNPPVTAPKNVNYWGASADVNDVVFTSSSKLTSDSDATGGSRDPADLYYFEVTTGLLRDLTPGVTGGADVTRVLDVSADGRRVYFVSAKQLVPGQGATTGPNIYLATISSPHAPVDLTYITTTTVDLGIDRTSSRELAASSDGTIMVFRSSSNLVPLEQTGGKPQVYVYDASRAQLSCASCTPTGILSPTGEANLTPSGYATATSSSTGPLGNSLIPQASPHVRNVASDGTVLFQTSTRLLPADVNGDHIDVYEYRAGALALVSTGTSRRDAAYAGVSTDGRTVFFSSADALAPGAQAGIQHIYAARVGGGFKAPPTPAQPCTGDGCRSAATAPPGSAGNASISFVGPGNVQPGPAGAAVFHVAYLSSRQQRRLARGRRIGLRVRVSEPGRVRAVIHARLHRRGHHARVRRVAKAAKRARRGGTLKVRVRLSRRARRYLKHHRQLRIAIKVRYSRAHGTQRAKVILRGHKSRHPAAVTRRSRHRTGRVTHMRQVRHNHGGPK